MVIQMKSRPFNKHKRFAVGWKVQIEFTRFNLFDLLDLICWIQLEW